MRPGSIHVRSVDPSAVARALGEHLALVGFRPTRRQPVAGLGDDPVLRIEAHQPPLPAPARHSRSFLVWPVGARPASVAIVERGDATDAGLAAYVSRRLETEVVERGDDGVHRLVDGDRNAGSSAWSESIGPAPSFADAVGEAADRGGLYLRFERRTG